MADSTEAPMSVSTVIYYKGFSTTLTRRNLEALAIDLVKKQFEDIDKLLEEYQEDIKPSWNKETNREVADKDPGWIQETIPNKPSSNISQGLGNCPKCGAPMKMSKAGRPYCSKLCWKNT